MADGQNEKSITKLIGGLTVGRKLALIYFLDLTAVIFISGTNAIIGLGHTLGLHVVAEGVELEQDVNLLCAAGCDELQGYYFDKPMPAEQFEIWLRMEQNAAENESGGIEDSAEWF